MSERNGYRSCDEELDLVIHVVFGEQKREVLELIQSFQVWVTIIIDRKGGTGLGHEKDSLILG